MGTVYGKRNPETGKIGRFITKGLVLWLDAQNTDSNPGSGSTWFDISGSGNDADVSNGGIGLGATGVDQGVTYLEFDGQDDYVTAPITNPGTSDFTITAWAYFYSNTEQEFIWAFRQLQGALATRSDTDGLKIRYYNNVIGISGDFWEAGPIPSINKWYEVSITRNNALSSMYVNGQFIASKSGDIQNFNSSSVPFYIGGYNFTSNPDTINGRIGEFRVYNRALTASEIELNFIGLRSRFGI